MSETQTTTSAVLRLFVLDMVWIYVLVMLTCLRPNRATIQPCDASLQTIKDDFRCPRNQFEWNKKAEEMKCASFSQSCTETSDFVYHCLINAWGNGTIHVCAPTRIIIGGSCAEFSKGGARVQEHYFVECTSCPFYYNSTTSYMYQECYESITTPRTISNEMNSSSSNSHGEDMVTAEEKNEGGVKRIVLLIGLTVLIIAVAVTCISVVTIYYKRRKRTEKSATATRLFTCLEKIIQKQKEQRQLIQLLIVGNSAEEDAGLPEGVDFPLTTKVEVDHLDGELANSESFTSVLKFLSAFGGQTVKGTISRMMKEVMSNELARQYNLLGKGQKAAFGKLRLTNVLFKCLQRNRPTRNCKRSEMETELSKWLAGARDRDGGRSRRGSATHQRQETPQPQQQETRQDTDSD